MEWLVGNTEFEADRINPGLAVSPWNGHRQFAYDLLHALKPRTVVELGTHYGCSFFAFLQACKDFDLETEVIAIDSWEGDPQAGFYGDEVWDTVNRTIEQLFLNQNYKLIRKFFDDAVSSFNDESIDIIHIDGLHTYDAVKNDFEKWLPKLSTDGIILFHDVASEKGYGTNVFWEEICNEYKYYYTFSHSWGLGVLFPKGDKYYRVFEENNFVDKVLVYEYFAKYKLQNLQLKDHILMVQERDKALEATEKLVQERDVALDEAQNIIAEKNSCIEKMENRVSEQDIEIDCLKQKISYLRNRGLIDRIRNREE